MSKSLFGPVPPRRAASESPAGSKILNPPKRQNIDGQSISRRLHGRARNVIGNHVIDYCGELPGIVQLVIESAASKNIHCKVLNFPTWAVLIFSGKLYTWEQSIAIEPFARFVPQTYTLELPLGLRFNHCDRMISPDATDLVDMVECGEMGGCKELLAVSRFGMGRHWRDTRNPSHNVDVLIELNDGEVVVKVIGIREGEFICGLSSGVLVFVRPILALPERLEPQKPGRSWLSGITSTLGISRRTGSSKLDPIISLATYKYPNLSSQISSVFVMKQSCLELWGIEPGTKSKLIWSMDVVYMAQTFGDLTFEGEIDLLDMTLGKDVVIILFAEGLNGRILNERNNYFLMELDVRQEGFELMDSSLVAISTIIRLSESPLGIPLSHPLSNSIEYAETDKILRCKVQVDESVVGSRQVHVYWQEVRNGRNNDSLTFAVSTIHYVPQIEEKYSNLSGKIPSCLGAGSPKGGGLLLITKEQIFWIKAQHSSSILQADSDTTIDRSIAGINDMEKEWCEILLNAFNQSEKAIHGEWDQAFRLLNPILTRVMHPSYFGNEFDNAVELASERILNAEPSADEDRTMLKVLTVKAGKHTRFDALLRNSGLIRTLKGEGHAALASHSEKLVATITLWNEYQQLVQACKKEIEDRKKSNKSDTTGISLAFQLITTSISQVLGLNPKNSEKILDDYFNVVTKAPVEALYLIVKDEKLLSRQISMLKTSPLLVGSFLCCLSKLVFKPLKSALNLREDELEGGVRPFFYRKSPWTSCNEIREVQYTLLYYLREVVSSIADAKSTEKDDALICCKELGTVLLNGFKMQENAVMTGSSGTERIIWQRDYEKAKEVFFDVLWGLKDKDAALAVSLEYYYFEGIVKACDSNEEIETGHTNGFNFLIEQMETLKNGPEGTAVPYEIFPKFVLQWFYKRNRYAALLEISSRSVPELLDNFLSEVSESKLLAIHRLGQENWTDAENILFETSTGSESMYNKERLADLSVAKLCHFASSGLDKPKNQLLEDELVLSAAQLFFDPTESRVKIQNPVHLMDLAARKGPEYFSLGPHEGRIRVESGTLLGVQLAAISCRKGFSVSSVSLRLAKVWEVLIRWTLDTSDDFKELIKELRTKGIPALNLLSEIDTERILRDTPFYSVLKQAAKEGPGGLGGGNLAQDLTSEVLMGALKGALTGQSEQVIQGVYHILLKCPRDN